MNKIKEWIVNLLKEDNGNEVCIMKVLAVVGFFTVVFHVWCCVER